MGCSADKPSARYTDAWIEPFLLFLHVCRYEQPYKLIATSMDMRARRLKAVGLVCCILTLVVTVSVHVMSSKKPAPAQTSEAHHPTTTVPVEVWTDSVSTGDRPTSYPMTGYVLVTQYREQLSQSVNDFFQLAHIAAGWNLKIVEPFVVSEKLGALGLPNLHRKWLTLADIYDSTALHTVMGKCLRLGGREVISSFQGFLVNATRQFVALRFLKGPNLQNNVNPRAPTVYHCNEFSLLSLDHQLNHYLEQNMELRRKAMAVHGNQYKFKGVGSVCINGWGFSMEDVRARILSTARRSHSRTQDGTIPAITVVLPEWRRVVDYSPAPFYYQDPSFSWKFQTCDVESIPHGRRVVEATDAFIDSLNLHRPVLGIHIRIERLAISDFQLHYNGRYWHTCLKALEAVIFALRHKYNLKTDNIIAMHDFSQYGSITCHAPLLCTRIKTEVLHTLDRLGIRVVNYNPANENTDRTFVSLVDMDSLIRADYLLTVGSGGYHRRLIRLFQRTHSDDAVFNLCMLGPNNTQHHLPNLNLRLS